ERCPIQMLRVGDRSWGVQFHPEEEGDRVRRWNPERLRAMGFDPDTVVADAERYAEELDKTWSAVVGTFLSFCSDRWRRYPSPHESGAAATRSPGIRQRPRTCRRRGPGSAYRRAAG